MMYHHIAIEYLLTKQLFSSIRLIKNLTLLWEGYIGKHTDGDREGVLSVSHGAQDAPGLATMTRPRAREGKHEAGGKE
jgi:hypothetical protein